MIGSEFRIWLETGIESLSESSENPKPNLHKFFFLPNKILHKPDPVIPNPWHLYCIKNSLLANALLKVSSKRIHKLQAFMKEKCENTIWWDYMQRYSITGQNLTILFSLKQDPEFGSLFVSNIDTFFSSKRTKNFILSE